MMGKTESVGQIESLKSRIGSEEIVRAVRVQSTVRGAIESYLRKEGYVEISPVILSTLTDPLNHPVYDPSIIAYNQKLALTKSMIFHKQIAVQAIPGIFIMSPNIRLETEDKASTGRHLYEFTQADVEARGKSMDDMMDLAERMIVFTIEEVRKNNASDLEFFSRRIAVPGRPFRRIRYRDAYERYGSDFERRISEESKEPVWITGIPLEGREFYDLEDPDDPGYLRDMDLLWPEGYQEAISGGEREFKYERILQRIKIKKQEPESFRTILEMSMSGLEPSCGFGIGIERFTRYLCGLKHCADTNLFPRIPGQPGI
ncbi:MAG: asparagine synthetase A [Candidatus Thermoplasmatota archaeon]|nr:asparagine synthetase A [Candidatus Thermoplasmatota archaeon]